MSAFGVLFVLFLLGLSQRRGGLPPGAPAASDAAAQAAKAAADAAAKAAESGTPQDAAKAQEAAQTAQVLTAKASAQQTRAASTPAPFPQARPSGLPPFPGPGWKAAIPTNPAIVTRAQQLLPVLWRIGPGATQVEQTRGEWITYLATFMNPQKTIKGVTAHRLRGGNA